MHNWKRLSWLLFFVLILPVASADLADQLEEHVKVLSEDIGERHVWRPWALEKAGDYIIQEKMQDIHLKFCLILSMEGQ